MSLLALFHNSYSVSRYCRAQRLHTRQHNFSRLTWRVLFQTDGSQCCRWSTLRSVDVWTGRVITFWCIPHIEEMPCVALASMRIAQCSWLEKLVLAGIACTSIFIHVSDSIRKPGVLIFQTESSESTSDTNAKPMQTFQMCGVRQVQEPKGVIFTV